MDETPWAHSSDSYAGWIPNVGSHLSFSMIGEGKGPGIARFSQAFDGRIGRFVSALQDRPTDDFLVPPSMVRRKRPGIAQQWLMLGSTVPVHVAAGVVLDATQPRGGELDEQGMLTGTVHVIVHQPDVLKGTIQRWGVEEIRTLLRSAHRRFMVSNELTDRQLDDLQMEITRIVRWRAPASRCISFALMRTGELRLWYDDDGPFDAAEAKRRRTVARQAYFFLKDVVHHHTHHDSSSDQITPLVQVNASEPDRRSAGERKWRRETAWSLSRTVEALLRTGNLDDKRQALGILAYADAFQKSLFDHARDHEDPRYFVRGEAIYGFDFAHVRESLKVQIDRSQVRRTHVTTMLIAALASSIGALSLLSSMISTRNNVVFKSRSSDGMSLAIPDAILAPLAARPISVVAIVFLIVLLISAIVTDDGARLLRRGPRRTAQALRGATLSVTRLVGAGADFAHRSLIGSYAILIGALAFAVFRAPSLVRTIASGDFISGFF